MEKNAIKVDIFENGRFIGTLKINNRWRGIVSVTDEELSEEIEKRLPTLRGKKYSIAFS